MAKSKEGKSKKQAGVSKQKPSIKERMLTWWFSNFPPLQ